MKTQKNTYLVEACLMESSIHWFRVESELPPSKIKELARQAVFKNFLAEGGYDGLSLEDIEIDHITNISDVAKIECVEEA